MNYDRIIIDLMNRISELEERVTALENGNPSYDISKGSKKYRKLSNYLLDKVADGTEEVRLTFEEIEGILGFKLPDSKKYQAFWANTESHPIALSWLSTPFRTVDPDTDTGLIVWERMEQVKKSVR